MARPLLETKLYVPRSRRGLVPRPRLSQLLNRGVEAKLTLVSAPAGFGKTTLLTEWLDLSKCPAAWVSLDQADNHAISFWSYFIAALQTVEPHVGGSAVAVLQSPLRKSRPPRARGGSRRACHGSARTTRSPAGEALACVLLRQRHLDRNAQRD